MEYLLKTIDTCNCGATSYGTGASATQQWANKDAVDQMMATALVPTFVMDIDTRNSSATNRIFNFQLSAAGTFYICWGDGSREKITKTNTYPTTYSHTYTVSGTYTIRFNGLATSYSSDTSTSAITFISSNPQKNLVGISGNLGKIFPIINSSSTGKPRFYSAFYYCSNIIGPLPKGLFTGINGSPATYMFRNTFQGCTGLTGDIPEDFFGGLSGAPTTYMFDSTFYGCAGLTGIPLGLFGNISGTLQRNSFANTFRGCTALTGQSARNPSGTYLYRIWTSARSNQVGDMYNGATRLSDYSSMPSVWR